jgi:hypothetical protein
MNLRSSLAASALVVTSILVPALSQAIPFPQPRIQDDCQAIRDQINALPKQGGTVTLPSGTFNCKAPVIIAKNNVVLKGAGRTKTHLRLADFVHAPLLVIGHPHTIIRDGAAVTPWRIENVRVEDMSIDGNREHHYASRECGETHCDGDATSIRNNAITIRGATEVTIKDVTAHSSISGGLVTEKYCDNLKIINFESHSNYFDGFAGYETENSEFINVHLHHNRGAGISIDIQFNNNVFKGGRLVTNNDVGIFARDLSGNRFEGLQIINSGSFGIFMASADRAGDVALCARDNIFNGVKIIGSGKHALRVNDGCPGNIIENASLMRGNLGCVSDDGQTRISDDTVCE